MAWDYLLTKDAENDFKKLDGSQKKFVLAMLEKLRINPLPKSRGGYGTPLGNDSETDNLAGLLKLKARGIGIRVVYRLIEKDEVSHVIVIGMREEKEVYKKAAKRVKK